MALNAKAHRNGCGVPTGCYKPFEHGFPGGGFVQMERLWIELGGKPQNIRLGDRSLRSLLRARRLKAIDVSMLVLSLSCCFRYPIPRSPWRHRYRQESALRRGPRLIVLRQRLNATVSVGSAAFSYRDVIPTFNFRREICCCIGRWLLYGFEEAEKWTTCIRGFRNSIMACAPSGSCSKNSLP